MNKTEQINWRGGTVLVGYHLLLFALLPLYLLQQSPGLGLLAFSFVLYVTAAIGITAGYHRLYSHRTYKAHDLFEGLILFLGTVATQGSVIEWSHDHRLHHRYVDTERDPYGTQKGFWHSHLLWMFKKRASFDERIISDLMKNKLVVFQHRHYGLLLVLVNLLIFATAAWLFQDYLGALVFAILARMFMVHHCTWFINSLAHMWGSKPYSTEHSAVNNWILAILTMGEGYHNFHHTFAGDYRNGIRWYQYDITKGLIWLSSKLGLVSDLKMVRESIIEKKLIWMDRQQMLEKLEEADYLRPLKEEIVRISDALIGDLKTREVLARKLQRLQTSPEGDSALLEKLSAEARAVRQDIDRKLEQWKQLCRQVLEGPGIRARAR